MLTAQPFALYAESWWAYIGTGILLISFIGYLIRGWNLHIKMLLLSLLTAGAFSFTTISNAESIDVETKAPAAVAFILEFEQEGFEGETALLIQLFIVWGILLCLCYAGLFGYRNFQSKKALSKESSSIESKSIKQQGSDQSSMS